MGGVRFPVPRAGYLRGLVRPAQYATAPRKCEYVIPYLHAHCRSRTRLCTTRTTLATRSDLVLQH
jgi:hypothetical protein